MFKPGDRVKCVHVGSVRSGGSADHILVQGAIYTVEAMVPTSDGSMRVKLRHVTLGTFYPERFQKIGASARNLPAWW